jgi:Flp pilus assembly pilin Flp
MMTLVLNCLARLHRDEAGQGLVEYVLLLTLVCFGAIAGMGILASAVNSAFSTIGSNLIVAIS